MKIVIGAVGVAVAVGTGVAPLGAAASILAGAMIGGAAANAGIYAAGAFFGYHDFSWKEMGKTALDGTADGALFAGVGMIAKSVTYAVKNPEPLKAFLADETGGEINLSKFGKKNHAVESADTPLYESMMEERGISSTLTAEEKEACRAADMKMEYEGSDISKPYTRSRPSYGKNQVNEVWENAKDPITGKVYDPSGVEINWDRSIARRGQWDMGHIPGEKYSDAHQLYMDGVISKEEFLEWYRNPNNYRPELPSTNRSHKYE